MTEMLRATAVEALQDYVIRVTFSNGAVKDIDLSSDLSNARGVCTTMTTAIPISTPSTLMGMRRSGSTPSIRSTPPCRAVSSAWLLAWAELRLPELEENWRRARANLALREIKPLK